MPDIHFNWAVLSKNYVNLTENKATTGESLTCGLEMGNKGQKFKVTVVKRKKLKGCHGQKTLAKGQKNRNHQGKGQKLKVTSIKARNQSFLQKMSKKHIKKVEVKKTSIIGPKSEKKRQ